MNRKTCILLAATLFGLARPLCAATPVAVWDGDFSSEALTKFSSAGITLVDWNETHGENNSSVTIDRANQGLMIQSTTAMPGITVLARYSNLAKGTNRRVIATSCVNSDNSGYRTGIQLTADGTLQGMWDSGANGTASGSIAASGVLAFVYSTAGTYLYYGATTDAISNTASWGSSGLKSSSDTSIYGAAIGGFVAGSNINGYEAAQGMTIVALAVFNKVLTNAEMTSYVWPSEIETITISGDTSVSAINTQVAAVTGYREIVVSLDADATVDVDEEFAASIPYTIASEGTITLSAESQPDASYFTNADFSGVKGAVKRSWLADPGVVGFNFNSANGTDTSAALVAGTWQANASDASGTADLFGDGLSVLAWGSSLYSRGSSTFLDGYIDDAWSGNGATITLSNVPYETYDVVIYASTDSGSVFTAKTVNGTAYTWNAAQSAAVQGAGTWGSVGVSSAIYGVNSLRIKNLSGPLTIYGGSRTNQARGGIAAIQIMPTDAPDIVKTYTLALDGTATTWSAGTWTLDGATVSAPTAGNVVINATASTTLTLDADVTLGDVTVNGGANIVVNLALGEKTAAEGDTAATYYSFLAGKVAVASGVLQQGSAALFGTTPVVTVADGGTFDLNGINCANAVNLAGAGAGNWPWALTSSASAAALTATPVFTANTTIGGANKITLGADSVAMTIALNAHTLTKTGDGELFFYNVRTGNGTIDIAEGTLSVNQWTNLDGYETIDRHTTVIVRDGAVFKNGTNRRVWVDTLEVENNATVTTSAGAWFGISTALVTGGALTTTKLQFNDGATVTLSGDLKVATVVAGGALTVNLADGAAESTMIADDVTGLTTLTLGAEAAAMLTAGAEGTVTLGDGATLKLIVGDDEYDVYGYEPSVSGTGAVEYYKADAEGNPVQVRDEARLDGNKLIPTSQLVPVWSVEEGGEGKLSDGDKWSTVAMPESGTEMVTFSISGAGGKMEVDESTEYGTVYVSGAGTLELSGEGTLSVSNLVVVGGVTLTLSGGSPLSVVAGGEVSGEGTISVGAGAVLQIDGATCAAAIDNSGAVLLGGDAVTISGVITGESGSVLTNSAATATLSGENVFKHGSEIVAASGTLSLNAAGTGLKGRIAVLADATLVNARTSDAIDYNASAEEPVEVEVWGALQMGSTRWSLGDGDKNILVFHDGATIFGNGDGSGAFDFIANKSGKITTDGAVAISAKLRIRAGAVLTAEVEDGGVLTVSGGTVDCAGGLAKTGAGTLEIKTTAPNNSGGISLEEGYIVSTVFPSHNVAISDGAVFTLKDTQWVSENRFSGEGTLELYLVDSTRNFGGASTLDLPGKLKVTRTGNGWPVFTGAASPHFSSRPELEITAGDKAGIVLDVGYIGEDNAFKVKNLSGAGTISPQNGATGGNRFIDTLQTAATEFKGNFMAGGTGSGGSSERNAALIVRGDENIYGLTLSGTNTSKGDLVITDNGKVIFSGSGSWAKGAVTVRENGWLESTNANAVANLVLSDGANLVFPTSESTLQGLTGIDFASGVTRVYFADGMVSATGTTIIDWSGAGLTAAPGGEFELSGANAGQYKLVADTEGLKIGAAAQARIGDVAYETVEDAITALAGARSETIYILDAAYEMTTERETELNEAGMIWDSEARTIEFAAAIDGDGELYKTVAAAIEAGAAKITLNKDSAEDITLPADTALYINGYSATGTITTVAEGYVIGRTTDGDGHEIYSSIDNDASTWVGADGARWEVYSNWSTGAVPDAGTAVTFPAGTYTVGLSGYNDELHVCKSMAAAGTVTFTYYDQETDSYPEIALYGDISGNGKIILKRSGLRNLSGAKVTIACGLGVEYNSTTTNDSFLRDGEFEISGELTIDGYLKCDVATTATGETKLGDGGQLRANSDVQFTGTATIADGASFTISGESALDIATLRIEGSGSLTATSATAVGTRLVFANEENAVVAIPDNLVLGSSAVVELEQAGTLNAGTRRFDNTIVLPDGSGMKVTLAGYDELAVEFNVEGDADVATEVLALDGATPLATDDYTPTRTIGKLVIVPNWAWAFVNPVTGEKTAAKYAFFGSDDNSWETAANWWEVASTGVDWVVMADLGTIPGLPNSGKFAPILIDGSLIGDDSNKTMSLSDTALEGWALKLAALNGVDVSVATLNKFQGGCWIAVDETSKVAFTAWGSGTSAGALDYYVAGEDGITFNMAYNRSNTVGYYLKGAGSVKYASGVTAGTHTICRADMDIGTEGYKQVIEKTLVSFSNASVTFGLADGFAPVVNDRSDIAPVESAAALSGFEELGTWRIAQDSTGVKLQYVGYGSSEPEFNIMGGSGTKDWDAPENWSLGTFPSDGTAMIIPDGDMTVNLGTAKTLSQLFIMNTNETAVTVNIAGETLTAGVFSVQTNVTVAVTNAAQIAGTASGGGTIQYTGVASLPSGMTWTSEALEGTLWLKDISEKLGYQFNNLGSANSTVKLTNVSAGYLNDNNNATVNPALEIDGDGFTINDGNANRVVIFKSLSGDGALKFTGGSGSGCGMVIKDASGFTGVINVATARYEVTVGDSGSSGTIGRLVINAGKEVNIAGTNMWSAVGGMVVNGTMNIDTLAHTVTLSPVPTGAGTLVKTGSGALVVADSLAGFTGNIQVKEGTLILWDPESVGGTIEFAAGTTIGFVDSIAMDGSITVDRANKIIWDDDEVALKLFNTDLTESSTKLEDMTVTDNGDGTWTYEFALKVSPWFDFKFDADHYDENINYGQLYSGKLKNYGTSGVDLTCDGFTVAASLDAETGNLYTRTHPYCGVTYPTAWSAAVFATMPAGEDEVLMAFGTKSGGFLALIRGEGANDIKLVWGSSSADAYTTLATMKAKAAAQSKHLIVFSKSTDYINIYFDGSLVQKYPAAGIAIGNGFQIGSVHGGVASGVKRLGTDDPSEIKMLRIYNEEIGERLVAQLAAEFQFSDLGATSVRILDAEAGANGWGESEWYVQDGGAWTNRVNGEKVEGDDGSLPLENANVTITSGGDCEQWLNIILNENNELAENAVLGDLVFTGTQPITVRRSIGGFALSPSGVISNDTALTIYVGAIDMTANVLQMSETATLEFDPTDYLTGLRTAGRVNLTGVCDEFTDSTGNSRVTCASGPADGMIIFKSFGYDSDARCYYLETEAVREAKNVYVTTSGDGTGVVDGDTQVYYLDGDTQVNTLPIDGDVLHFNADSLPTNTIASSLAVSGISVPAGITLVVESELEIAVFGAGTILMDGVRPKASGSAASTALQDAEQWTGTLEIRNVNFGNTGLGNFGNTNSTLRLVGCSITPGGTSDADSRINLELSDGDAGYGLRYNYASAASATTQIGTLYGDGSFIAPGTNETENVGVFRVLDASAFTGIVSNAAPASATGGLLFEIGSDEATAEDGVLIASDGELTVADAIYASSRLVVRGTLKVSGEQALVYSDAVTFDGGTLVLDEGAYPMFLAPVTVSENGLAVDLADIAAAGSVQIMRVSDADYLPPKDDIAISGNTSGKVLVKDADGKGWSLGRGGFYLHIR